jgi:hypothetical protein
MRGWTKRTKKECIRIIPFPRRVLLLFLPFVVLHTPDHRSSVYHIQDAQLTVQAPSLLYERSLESCMAVRMESFGFVIAALLRTSCS